MSRRNWLNLGLLILVGVLVILVVYEPGKQPTETHTLTSLKPEEIDHIRIERKQAPTLVLEKRDGAWYLQAPYDMPANDFKVDELLRLAEAVSHDQRDLAKLDRGKFGLDAASASITFNQDEPLRFGGTDPLNHRRYVGYKGTLHLITDTFYYQLGRAATDFIDHTLLAGDHAITGLYLPALQLQLTDAGWQVQPEQAPVSNDRINELLQHWQYAQAVKIEPWKEKDRKAAEIIRIERADAPAVEFVLLSRKPRFILARPDKSLQYELPKDQFPELMQLPAPIDAPGNEAAPANTPE